MKKWIRWQGIIIFVGVVAVIVIFVFIFAGSLVGKAVEKAGTRAVGARVDVADADVSLFPAGLVLEGVQVTNPDAPMTNAVEIGRVGLTLEIGHLLSRKRLLHYRLHHVHSPLVAYQRRLVRRFTTRHDQHGRDTRKLQRLPNDLDMP